MKNLRLLLSIVALALLTVPLHAQPLQKTYDLGADDYGNMSEFDANGDIYTVGSSNFTGAGGYDAFLMKSDTAGVFQWHKQYGGSGTEFGTGMVAVNDGIVIAGRSNSFTTGNTDILLVKTDLNGDILWAKTYGTDSSEYATHIAATADNGFIVTGETNGIGNGGKELFLLKTDSTGNVEWFNAYGSNSDERANHVFQDSDGGYIASGESNGAGGSGMTDMYLIKVDSIGNIEAQFLIGTSGDEALKRVIAENGLVTLAGNIRAAGGDDDIFVGVLNGDNFTFNWFNSYGGSGNDAATDLVTLGGDGIVVTGFSESFGAGSDGFLAQLDTAGNPAFAALLQGSADEIIQDIAIGNNGGLITAYTNSYGGTANDIYLITIGDAFPCDIQPINITPTPVTPTLIGPVLNNHSATSGNITGTPVTLTQSSTTATINDFCAGLLFVDAGNDQFICNAGEQVQIGGNPTISGGTAPYTYSWSPSTGLDSDTISNPTSSATVTTQYFLSVTDSNGATVTDSVTVFVGTQPTASISPTSPNICAGQNVTLTASGGTSYMWSTGDNSDMITEFPGPGTTQYSVTVTDNGCSDTASTIVNTTQLPTVMVALNNLNICAGSSVMLSASGAQTYNWAPSAGLSSDTTANPVASPTNTTTYTVTGYNNNCPGTPVDVIVNVNVCVLTADAGSDQAICPGGALALGGSPSAQGGTPPYTYSWSPATGLNDTAASNPVASSPTATTEYILTITDSTGATDTDSVTVSIGSAPTASIVPPFPNICEGQNVTLTASGGSTYLWSNGETTAAIVDFPPLGSTIYSVTVYGNGCVDSASTTVTSYSRPTVTVTPSDTSICDTSSITLTASGAQTYSWTPSTGLSNDTASTVVASPASTTTYAVTGQNAHCAGNPVSVTITVTNCVGINELTEMTLNIYPNPANDIVNIQFNAKSSADGVLSLVTADGRIVQESPVSITAGENILPLYTEILSKGLYYLKIKSERFTVTGSFMRN